MDQQSTPTSQTVLVVDDEKSLLLMLSNTLQEAGFTVIQASDGKEGYTVAMQQHPALIVTDNLMPIMSGIDMVTKLRKDSWGAKVPVIVLTNVNDVSSINKSLQAGITDYVMKGDVDLSKIAGMVKAKLERNG